MAREGRRAIATHSPLSRLHVAEDFTCLNPFGAVAFEPSRRLSFIRDSHSLQLFAMQRRLPSHSARLARSFLRTSALCHCRNALDRPGFEIAKALVGADRLLIRASCQPAIEAGDVCATLICVAATMNRALQPT